MNLFGGGVYKNRFSSIFVKFALGFLFLGIAYRLFSSCILQFSPAILVDRDGADAGKTSPAARVAAAVAEPTSPPPPPLGIASDLMMNSDADWYPTSENEKCNIFVGDWVPDPDGPRYTNSSCQTIEDPQNCMTNGRPDFDYVYWKWKPTDCDLPKFEPNKFLDMMRHKSFAFIGDSIMRNHVQSLLCMLSEIERAVDIYHDGPYKNRKWSFPSHNLTVSLVWSPYLTKATTFEDDNGISTSLTQLHLDQPDPTWASQIETTDYAVVAGGKWFLKSALYYSNKTLIGCHNCHDPNVPQLGIEHAYRKALRTTLEFIAKRGPSVVFRSTAPDHFENGEWDTGGYCNRTRLFRAGEVEIGEMDEMMRRVEVEEFEGVARGAGVSKMRLVDVTMASLLRPDGHPSVYRQFHPYGRVQSDCLHWCLPGPIDAWNDLVMDMLLEDSQF